MRGVVKAYAFFLHIIFIPAIQGLKTCLHSYSFCPDLFGPKQKLDLTVHTIKFKIILVLVYTF